MALKQIKGVNLIRIAVQQPCTNWRRKRKTRKIEKRERMAIGMATTREVGEQKTRMYGL